MITRPTIAVIVTTYNRPKALQWALVGIINQTCLPDLVVVADDGSGAETRNVVHQLQDEWHKERRKCPLIHAWQPDEGFRAARIRNLAVANAAKHLKNPLDLLIFLDGDCIAFPSFIENHLKIIGTARRGLCSAGGRSLLSVRATQTLENKNRLVDPNDYWSITRWPSLFRLRLTGDLNRVSNLIKFPDFGWRVLQSKKWQIFRTCNAAVCFQDFVAINGFSEQFTGWGYEDSDLAIRLIRSGVRMKSGRFASNVLHLWHPESDRSFSAKNKKLLETSWSGKIAADNGLSQHIQGLSCA